MPAMSPDAFAADLLASAVQVAAQSVPVVKRVAQAMKDEAQANVLKSAPVHNAGAHRAINYDEPALLGVQVRSEVGYDRDKSGGALGNLLEYGGGGDKSPAHRDLGRAADSAEARFVDSLQMMASRLL